MPVPLGIPEDSLQEIIDGLEPVGPSIAPPVEPIKDAAPGSTGWRDRLRTTEAELQRLSNGYPFTWHGEG
jgi:hypothetical protein